MCLLATDVEAGVAGDFKIDNSSGNSSNNTNTTTQSNTTEEIHESSQSNNCPTNGKDEPNTVELGASCDLNSNESEFKYVDKSNPICCDNEHQSCDKSDSNNGVSSGTHVKQPEGRQNTPDMELVRLSKYYDIDFNSPETRQQMEFMKIQAKVKTC